MPMLNLFDKIFHNDKGDVVVEFAAALPLLLLLSLGMTEIARAIMQANTVEKGMRAAAVYAARSNNPTSGQALINITNIAKTGTIDGSGAVLVSGWSLSDASLSVSEVTYNLDGTNIPVIRLNASVPFDPIVPGLMDFFGLEGYRINLSHEQAFIDN